MSGDVEVVVEATGNPPVGIRHARAAIAAGKHIVMVNVESRRAGRAAPRRRGAQGRRGLFARLWRPAGAHGGDGGLGARDRIPRRRRRQGTKYLPAYRGVTPDGVWRHYGLTAGEAQSAGMNPQMFNSFLDGTKSPLKWRRFNAGLDVPTGDCCSRPAASTICRM